MNLVIAAVVVGIVGTPFLVLWGCYNGLVMRRNKSRQALSGIAVQLKRRADLIPNLVEVVRGYAKHERAVLERVTQLRDLAIASSAQLAVQESHANAATLEQVAKNVGAAVARLFAVVESYPDLKASANFLDLQKQLAVTEDQIVAARRIYNGNVACYNTATEQFPTNVVARWFGFLSLSFFEQEDPAANQVPSVVGLVS